MARNALGLEFGSAARLSKRPGSVWNCLWGHALKRSPGIIRKSRVSFPGPGFLARATSPSLPKKHYNGLNQTKPNGFSVVFSRYIATTQMQPTDARKAFPCFDEPALKATFNVTLLRKDPMTSLANMDLIQTTTR